LSTITLQYTKLVIPASQQNSKRIIHCPLLNTKLFHGQTETMFDFPSVVDSGADFCVFPEKYGSIIGLKIKNVRPTVTHGVGGEEELYFHKIRVGVNIRNQMWKFSANVGFSYKMNKKGAGLLGRQGFFNQFTEVAFNQNKRMFRIKE